MLGAAVTELPVAPVAERGEAKMTRPRYKAANHKDGRATVRATPLLLRFRLGKNNRWTDGRTDGRTAKADDERQAEAGNAQTMLAWPFTALNNTCTRHHGEMRAGKLGDLAGRTNIF